MIITPSEYIIQDSSDKSRLHLTIFISIAILIVVLLSLLWYSHFAVIYIAFMLSALIIKKPDIGLCLLAFVLPFFGNQSGGKYSVYFPEVIIILLIIPWLFSLSGKKIIRLRRTPVDMWILLFAFAVLLSVFSAADHLVFEIKRIKNPLDIIYQAFISSPDKWISPLRYAVDIIIYTLFYFYLVNNINGLNQVKKITAALLAGLFAAVLIGYVQYFRLLNFSEILPYTGAPEFRNSRMYGLFGEPNYFAQYLAFTIPLLVSILFYTAYGRKKILYPVILFILLAIVLSFQKTALLILFCTACFVIFAGMKNLKTYFENKKLRQILVISLISLLILLYSLILIKGNMEYSKSDKESFNVNKRTSVWLASSMLYLKNPLFGIGAGNYSIAHNDTFFGENKLAGQENKTALSSILQFLAESGPAAVIAYLAIVSIFIYFSIVNFISRTDRDPSRKYIIGLSAMLLSIVIYSLFQHVFFIRINFILFLLICGMLFFLIRDNLPAVYVTAGKNKKEILLYAVLIVFLVRFLLL